MKRFFDSTGAEEAAGTNQEDARTGNVGLDTGSEIH